MALSKRGQKWAEHSSDLLIWSVLKDLWDPKDNPNGYVSLGVAENALMHDELTRYINANIKLPPNGLTYGDGGSGSKATQAAMARFLNRKLKPVTPIKGADICTTNGVSCSIEHLSYILADGGDVFLLGQPHYGAFIDDIELRPGVEVAPVSFDTTDPFSLNAVKSYERIIHQCQRQGKRVAALILCNPHNPLGRCYPRSTIVSLMKLCQTHKIHFISDEIYALSVFRTPDTPSDPTEPFTSLSSIPTTDLIDPSLTHILYGLSKDFGANGLRLGAIISQHNPALHKALISVAIYSYASSLAEGIATKLLGDDEYVDWYIAENCRRLRRKHELVVDWAERWGLEYAKGVNAGFFLWVEFGKQYAEAVRTGKIGVAKGNVFQEDKEEKRVESEDLDVRILDQLLKEKVFLASGAKFGSEKPGWVRIVFSQNEVNLKEGVEEGGESFGIR